MQFAAYVLGFLAAVANAAANVLQRAANRAEDQRLEFSFALIRHLLRSRLWLAGMGAILVSFLLQATGLGLGTLAGVEPLLILELPLTLIASHLFLGGNLGSREWAAILVMSGGTIGMIAFLGPGAGSTTGIGWLVWLVAIAVTITPVLLAYWYGQRATDPGRRAMLLGAGAGISYGLAAALLKGMTNQFMSGGLVSVLASWQLYSAIAVGALAMWMFQNALNAGRLAAAQPGVTLGDPYVAIAWGAAVFHEPMRTGIWILAAVLCGAAMTVGAMVLATSPALRGQQGQHE